MSAESLVKAANTGDFKDVTKKKVTVQGKEILIIKAGGKYYAMANRCPHMNGDLSAGTLEGTVVTCPRHGSQFDVTNGHNVRWLKGTGTPPDAAQEQKTYKVKIEGDDIFIQA